MSRADLTARFGVPQMYDLDSNGLGDFDAWFMRHPCGLEIALSIYHLGRDMAPIEDAYELAVTEVHANEPEVEHLLFHLDLGEVTIHRWQPDHTCTGPRSWRLLRQDEHGNQVEMAAFTSRCEAEAMAQTFERRGHKQAYCVATS